MQRHYDAWEAWVTGPAHLPRSPISAYSERDAKSKASKWAQMAGGTWTNITSEHGAKTFCKSYGAGFLVLRRR